MSTGDEADLVERAIRGDEHAFAELYDRHAPRVYRYVFQMVQEIADAEDLTAQTFLKAWGSIRRFKPRGRRFSAWLLRIAHNLTVDHVRRSPKSHATEAHSLLARVASSPQEAHEKSSRLESLGQALSRLPPEQREVIVLRFIQGLGHREVARILGKTVVASRAMQYRALISLRAHLRELEEGSVYREGDKRRTAQVRPQNGKGAALIGRAS